MEMKRPHLHQRNHVAWIPALALSLALGSGTLLAAPEVSVDTALEDRLIDPERERARFESRVKSCDEVEDVEAALNCLANVSVEDPLLAALGRVEDSSLPDGTDPDPTAGFAPPAAGPEPDAPAFSPATPDPGAGDDPTAGAPDGGGFLSGLLGGM